MGSEMCIRDRSRMVSFKYFVANFRSFSEVFKEVNAKVISLSIDDIDSSNSSFCFGLSKVSDRIVSLSFFSFSDIRSGLLIQKTLNSLKYKYSAESLKFA